MKKKADLFATTLVDQSGHSQRGAPPSWGPDQRRNLQGGPPHPEMNWNVMNELTSVRKVTGRMSVPLVRKLPSSWIEGERLGDSRTVPTSAVTIRSP